MNVGSKTWTRGIEVTIISEPYELYGGMWQDAQDENGKVWTIATKEQRTKNAAAKKIEWKRQQEAFARL